MDVIPLSPTEDRIKCYKESSPGSGTWNLLNDVTLSSTVGGSGYVAWNNDLTNGFCIRRSNGGTFAAPPSSGYIDKVEFKVATAP